MHVDEFRTVFGAADGPLELVDGEIVALPPCTPLRSALTGLIYCQLREHVERHNLGVVPACGTAYQVGRDPDTVRVPDVSFVPRARIAGETLGGVVATTPALAVEIVTEHTMASALHRRALDYVRAGVDQFWVLWPVDRALSVYYRNAKQVELRSHDTLDVGDILPGFEAQVATLFGVWR